MLKALPKMAKAASHEDLQNAFKEHLEVTRGQIARLEAIFEELEVSPKSKTCHAMQGLIEEGSEVIDEDGNDSVKDAALIGAAQRVEHYEMAGYGCSRTFAALLGLDNIAAKLQETLDEEREADEELTQLAESVINLDAENAVDDDDEEPATKSRSSRKSKEKLVSR